MFEVEIEKWIPRFLLQDRNGYALAKAIEAGLNTMNRTVAEGLACLSDIESMPEWRLDEMAWEYAADWYDAGASLAAKRQQITGAVDFYNRLGTVYAVRSAVEAAFGSGRVEEWYQYSGSPFHFRVFADGTLMSGEGRKKLQRMVDKVKNARSVLDQICFTGQSGNAAEMFMATKAVGVLGKLHAYAREE